MCGQPTVKGTATVSVHRPACSILAEHISALCGLNAALVVQHAGKDLWIERSSWHIFSTHRRRPAQQLHVTYLYV